MKSALLEKIRSRRARVAVFGLGYVGLPLALRFAEAGFETAGFDIDEDKVRALNAGKSYIERISGGEIQRARDAGFTAASDFSECARAHALIICVPTPLGAHREPDLRYVTATMDAIAPHLRAGSVVALESTTYPGTTEEELLPRIEARGFTAGEDVFLVYSPEREDPGNRDFPLRKIPKLCAGHTANCLEVGAALYRAAVDRVVPVSSTRAAEMTKLVENIHRAVNIGLVNELRQVCDAMGLDIFEIIDAASTKPFGYTPYYPGPGLGGHCLPIDPFYLAWKAREYGVHSKFIELAGEVNAGMPAWFAAKAADALNRAGKAVRGAAVLVLGVAYKKNVGDMRESPALKIMQILREQGANISYADPHVPKIEKLRGYDFNMAAEKLSAELLAQSDLVILCADHARFDYAMIKRHSALLLDTRGAMREQDEKNPPIRAVRGKSAAPTAR
ncbi:MAG: nucleotide sugar dehydrogenase [Gammaproteobacteria bacterium]|nr:nucleotide sugar dehydrogenase [Gammaproteobacteria bacterium]